MALVVSVAAVVLAGLLAWVVVSAIRIEGDKFFNPNRQPTPGETTSLGLRIPTDADIVALEAQVSGVPHITKVEISYHAATISGSRGTNIVLTVDLLDAAGAASPDYVKVRDDILRIIWGQLYDVGIISIQAWDPNGQKVNLAHESLEGLYAKWGRPGASPSATPKPS
ncbi:MAG: hypothetical protein WAV45_00225 [Propionibacteriaceae bacterium]|nr:hypothetical protein [Micropruina sp.]HBX81676.1 hypothetical protein [Propionibacteriaceae bacterium]